MDGKGMTIIVEVIEGLYVQTVGTFPLERYTAALELARSNVVDFKNEVRIRCI